MFLARRLVSFLIELKKIYYNLLWMINDQRDDILRDISSLANLTYIPDGPLHHVRNGQVLQCTTLVSNNNSNNINSSNNSPDVIQLWCLAKSNSRTTNVLPWVVVTHRKAREPHLTHVYADAYTFLNSFPDTRSGWIVVTFRVGVHFIVLICFTQ